MNYRPTSADRVTVLVGKPQLGDAHLTHAKFLHLAADRHWKLFHELDVPGRFEVRDAAFAETAQIVSTGLMAIFDALLCLV